MIMGPAMLERPPAADVQEPDTNARPAMTTRAVTADVQNLFTKGTPSSKSRDPAQRAAGPQREVDSSRPLILGPAKQPGRNNTVTNPGLAGPPAPAGVRRRAGAPTRDKPSGRPHT
jgi:hypothetical protein